MDRNGGTEQTNGGTARHGGTARRMRSRLTEIFFTRIINITHMTDTKTAENQTADTTEKQVCYLYDHKGRYYGFDHADPDPMQPGEYILPENATTTALPDIRLDKWENFFWTGNAWIIRHDEALKNAEKIRAIKQRNLALAASDWTQLPDAPLTPDDVLAWRIYRHELRDLPAQENFPDCEWPAKPGEKTVKA